MSRNFNQRSTQAKQARRNPNPNITGAARDGFTDAQSHKPYRQEYETANHVYQANYERGRLAFLYGKQAGMSDRALSWPKQTIMPRFMETLLPMVAQDLRPYQEKGT